MQMEGLMGGFYRLSEWIMRLAIINLLWILFTLVGAVLLGLMPASIAMFAVVRKWIMGDTEIPIFKTFFSAYKKEFIKGNIFGLIIAAAGYVLYIDLQYLALVDGALHTFLLTVLFLAGILYFILVIYLIPVYVHFDIKFNQYFKYAVMFGIANFHITVFMAAGLAVLYYVFMKIPGLVPFFSISIPAFFIMWCVNLAFKALAAKKEKLEQEKEEKEAAAGTYS
ncbi:Uncharacterized membrane protein YesL [Evansella caseinilytica]|uniref:Uncharacterized membrane protein YesL n=1 Tax=Evansella caseinilytica TaxID=1503961 RepID=A0A1H3NX81_9BACI|nr:YesL family protein [Evansella caseinilytica]SDY93502.1 Uncharacterized membrane protein YesL [Evansella caseinilytica]